MLLPLVRTFNTLTMWQQKAKKPLINFGSRVWRDGMVRMKAKSTRNS